MESINLLIMKVNEIIDEIIETGLFDVHLVEYKYKEHRRVYGTSFDATLKHGDYVRMLVNEEEVLAKRIIEEFGKILFIYDFKQKEYLPEHIKTIKSIN